MSFIARRVGTDAVHGFLESSRGLGGNGENEPRSIQQLFHDQFFPGGTSELEAAFRTELRARVPVWYEEGRSLELAPNGNSLTQIAFPKTPALAWRVGEDLLGVTSVRAEIEIVEGSASASATILLGGRPRVENTKATTALAIEMDPAHGVRVRRSRNTEYEMPPPWADSDSSCLSHIPPLGKPFEVRVRLSEGRAVVELDGIQVLDVDTAECDFQAYLGICAPRGGMVRWHSLDIEHAH
jgi:hypothetical protein